MQIRKALIIAKKSAYQAYFKEYRRASVRRLEKTGDEGLRHIRRSHETHYRSLESIQKSLKKHGIAFESRFRGEKIRASSFDLVIAVGGDGTFLDASHAVTDQPVLGVNSDISHSVGHFCSVHGDHFEKALTRILRGEYQLQHLHRLKILLNGRAHSFPVLNDLLVCHACPAAMNHYLLRIGDAQEKQRSSGLWIATASGSTAGIHSAGGKILPITSQRVQYFPRELFSGHGARYRLKGGLITPGARVSVVSQMQEGVLYLDGAHHRLPFHYGDRLEISEAPQLNRVLPALGASGKGIRGESRL